MLQPGVQASPDESGLCTFIIVCKEVKSLYLHFVAHLFTKSVTHQFLCFFFFLRLWMTLGCQAWTELTAWQSIWWSWHQLYLARTNQQVRNIYCLTTFPLCPVIHIHTHVFVFSH